MAILSRAAGLSFAALVTLGVAACDNESNERHDAGVPSPTVAFTQQNLISDQAGVASHVDPSLVNAWGLAMDSNGFWIANNGTGRVLVVAPDGSPLKGAPRASALTAVPGITGIVNNTTSGFRIGPNSNRAPAQMLVASETGQIFGINANVAPTPQIVVDRTAQQAVYKGLALLPQSDGTTMLAAADFHNGRIDMFDSNFQLVAQVFTDTALRAGLAPFNIVTVGSNAIVTYAVQDAAKHDDVPGVGNGRVDMFDMQGRIVRVLLDGGQLNAPWGVAFAPSDFGPASNMLIVGNFGDGTLLAIDPTSGNVAGQLLMTNGNVLAIDGLWGIAFGNGQNVGSSNVLFFNAGPNDEMHGLFGRIVTTVIAPP
jgi:uncharacterized protein (TIGR03118 family)